MLPTKFKNTRFPAWSGPLVGAAIAVYVTQKSQDVDGPASTAQLILAAVLGAFGGSLIWIIDFIENGGNRVIKPNMTYTVLLLFFGIVLFWVPFLGVLILSYALSRSRWLEVSDWFLFPISVLWLISAVISFIAPIMILGEFQS